MEEEEEAEKEEQEEGEEARGVSRAWKMRKCIIAHGVATGGGKELSLLPLERQRAGNSMAIM